MNPHRVDLKANDNGLVVEKFWKQDGRFQSDPNGAKLYRAESQEEAVFGLMAAVDWLENHEYVVILWPYGARAFKGLPEPIRKSHQIIRRRAEIERQVQSGRLPDWFNFFSLDFGIAM